MTSKLFYSDRIRDYYTLTKPGIIYGNLLSAVGGYFFGAQGVIHLSSFLAAAIGTSSIIASACVFNNYIDRHIDARMQRTHKRALPGGRIPLRQAIIFGSTLGFTGLIVLILGTNLPTLLLGVTGWLTYVVVYTYAKPRTVHATLLGSIPGATPIAAGYTAATGRFDVAALLLFSIMVVWQLPHFYAISMFRRDDYAAAGVPVLAVVKGMAVTARTILGCISVLVVAFVALYSFGGASASLTLGMVGIVLYWLAAGWRQPDSDSAYSPWARRMFRLSLIVLLSLCVALALDHWLP